MFYSFPASLLIIQPSGSNALYALPSLLRYLSQLPNFLIFARLLRKQSAMAPLASLRFSSPCAYMSATLAVRYKAVLPRSTVRFAVDADLDVVNREVGHHVVARDVLSNELLFFFG